MYISRTKPITRDASTLTMINAAAPRNWLSRSVFGEASDIAVDSSRAAERGQTTLTPPKLKELLKFEFDFVVELRILCACQSRASVNLDRSLSWGGKNEESTSLCCRFNTCSKCLPVCPNQLHQW